MERQMKQLEMACTRLTATVRSIQHHVVSDDDATGLINVNNDVISAIHMHPSYLNPEVWKQTLAHFREQSRPFRALTILGVTDHDRVPAAELVRDLGTVEQGLAILAGDGGTDGSGVAQPNPGSIASAPNLKLDTATRQAVATKLADLKNHTLELIELCSMRSDILTVAEYSLLPSIELIAQLTGSAIAPDSLENQAFVRRVSEAFGRLRGVHEALVYLAVKAKAEPFMATAAVVTSLGQAQAAVHGIGYLLGLGN